MENDSLITLAVLAGGEGSRMGRPKALLTLSGVPILQFLLSRFHWPGPTLLITAPGREHPPGADLFDCEASDAVAGQGPLRGVLTALRAAITPLVIVTTVDMPCVGGEQFQWLAQQFSRASGDSLGLMTRRGVEAEVQGEGGGLKPALREMIEPFPSIWRKAAGEMLIDRLERGRGSVQALAGQPNIGSMPVPPAWPAEVWTNLNHPGDLKVFERG